MFLSDIVKLLPWASQAQQVFSNSQPAGLSQLDKLPGGSTFFLCPESRGTDLFQISSVQVDHDPVHMRAPLDGFLNHIAEDTFVGNATIKARSDCGSHCFDHGDPSREDYGTDATVDFCRLSNVDPERDENNNNTSCPPEAGPTRFIYGLMAYRMLVPTIGWYNFTFDAKTAEGERIYCLTTEVYMMFENEDWNESWPIYPWNNCTWTHNDGRKGKPGKVDAEALAARRSSFTIGSEAAGLL